MSQVLEPHDPQPLGDFDTAARRLRYGVLGDPANDIALRTKAVSSAEAVFRSIEDRGLELIMVVSDEGHPCLALRLPIFPPSIHDRSILAVARHRFLSEDSFARAMFGVLDVAGRVYAARPARGFSIDFDKREVL